MNNKTQITQYRVELEIFIDENDKEYTNPEVMNLVNVNDDRDYIPCAQDEFTVGELVDEDEFEMFEANYVDEQGVGTTWFAYKITSPPNTNYGVDGI